MKKTIIRNPQFELKKGNRVPRRSIQSLTNMEVILGINIPENVLGKYFTL
jgi:hypothetical protein